MITKSTGLKRTGQGGKIGGNLQGNRFSDCAGGLGLHCAHQKDRVGVAGKIIGEVARLKTRNRAGGVSEPAKKSVAILRNRRHIGCGSAVSERRLHAVEG